MTDSTDPPTTATDSSKGEKCDGCGNVVERWTIAKGFDLLCDSCLFKRLAERR